MARLYISTFRVNEDERQMIARLSERLQRSQRDSIRWMIWEAMEQINILWQKIVRYSFSGNIAA